MDILNDVPIDKLADFTNKMDELKKEMLNKKLIKSYTYKHCNYSK